MDRLTASPFKKLDKTIPFQNNLTSNRGSINWEDCKEKNLLPSNIYSICKTYLEENPDLSFLPKADPAFTEVFLPPDLPVVFKQTGPKKSIDRFYRMCLIREICEKSNYTCLVVPKARPHGQFIIEEKIPLREHTQKGQIGLYCENREKFSLAVREFTGLLTQTLYPDILTFSHPYQQQIPLGRYDNIPFFFDGNIAKIGLIDLEGVEARKETISQEDLLQIARTAISLFPLHFDDILSVLQENMPEWSLNREELERYQTDVLQNFLSIYQDHRIFIERKKPVLNTPLFSLEQKEELKELLGSHLEMTLVVEKLLEKIETAAGLVNSQVLSIAHICARTMTLSVADLTEEKELQELITPVLEELKSKQDICFANIYSNRAGQLRIRIHF